MATDHHIAAGMLEKTSGWASFSAKYMNEAVIRSIRASTQDVRINSSRFNRATSPKRRSAVI